VQQSLALKTIRSQPNGSVTLATRTRVLQRFPSLVRSWEKCGDRSPTLRVKTEGSIKSQGLSAPYAASNNDSAARKSKRGTTFL
jgi:hypothetical protein